MGSHSSVYIMTAFKDFLTVKCKLDAEKADKINVIGVYLNYILEFIVEVATPACVVWLFPVLLAEIFAASPPASPPAAGSRSQVVGETGKCDFMFFLTFFLCL